MKAGQSCIENQRTLSNWARAAVKDGPTRVLCVSFVPGEAVLTLKEGRLSTPASSQGRHLGRTGCLGDRRATRAF